MVSSPELALGVTITTVFWEQLAHGSEGFTGSETVFSPCPRPEGPSGRTPQLALGTSAAEPTGLPGRLPRSRFVKAQLPFRHEERFGLITSGHTGLSLPGSPRLMLATFQFPGRASSPNPVQEESCRFPLPKSIR